CSCPGTEPEMLVLATFQTRLETNDRTRTTKGCNLLRHSSPVVLDTLAKEAILHRLDYQKRGRAMPRMVNCVKLGRELPGLEALPFPGRLGERIYNEVSQQAWNLWPQQST